MNTSQGPGVGKVREIARVYCGSHPVRKNMLVILKSLGFSCDAPVPNDYLMLIQAYDGKLRTQWMTEADFNANLAGVPMLVGQDICITNGDNVCDELAKLPGIDLPIKRLETIDVTSHTTPGIFLLNMMTEHTKRNDLLDMFEPMGGAVTVELKINGVVVPFAKSIEEMWTRLNSHNDELAMEKAIEMVAAAGLDDVAQIVGEFKFELVELLRRKFPNIEITERY